MPKFVIEWREITHFKKTVNAMTEEEAEELALFNVESQDETGKTETEIDKTTKVEN